MARWVGWRLGWDDDAVFEADIRAHLGVILRKCHTMPRPRVATYPPAQRNARLGLPLRVGSNPYIFGRVG